jgi:magnesium-dependent phosphatase 1
VFRLHYCFEFEISTKFHSLYHIDIAPDDLPNPPNISSGSIIMILPMPKLVAFDLDGTVWAPDMYMLWGGGAPFTPQNTYNNNNINKLMDKSNQPVRLLGDVANILDELEATENCVISWVSCTDEPAWADDCLDLFESGKKKKLSTFVDLAGKQIFKANKKEHFQKLKKNFPAIQYSEMIFYDNELYNINNVNNLGVHSVHTPEGMQREIYEQGLDEWRAKQTK